MSGAARENGELERLFGDYQRTDRRSRQPLEDNYTFLDRVDQVYWEKVRHELERWFASYPASGRAELRSRFRHRDDDQHYGAYWELYLHRLFSCLGYSIEVHPDLPDTSTHPDFRVTKDGYGFLLEATTTFSGIVEEGRAGDREAWILAAIEKASNPNFYVHLEFEKVGHERPSDKEIFEPLQTWLEGLDPDEPDPTSLLDGPVLRLTPRDWVIVFRPIPVKPEARGKRPDKGMLGMGPAIAGPVNDVDKIKGGLKRKARKYGKPDEPLAVAVLSLSSPKREDIESSLLGRVAWRFDPLNPTDGEWVRQQDGFWFRDGKPRSTKVSAVLVGVGLLPWIVPRAWPTLWLNPWADRPLPGGQPLPTGRPDTNGVVSYQEASAAPDGVFGLPSDWPGPEASFE